MNILCIGYYDKFSRFFLQIENELKQQYKGVEISIESTYLSGFLYSFVRRKSGSWISCNAWYKALKNKSFYEQQILNNAAYKGFDIEQIIEKHTSSDHTLRLQLMAYIDILETKVEKANLILMIGDLRLPFEVAKKIAEQKKIPIYHFEQGPFSTTLIDKKGVNANASIRGYTNDAPLTSEKQKFVDFFLQKTKSKKYNRSPIYRGLDYFLEFFLMKTSVFPPDIKINNSIFKKDYHSLNSKQFKPKNLMGHEKVYLLITQVPFDVNMTHHSPHYKNHTEILTNVHENLPNDSILVVREHPLYKGKYESSFYDYIKKSANIFVDNNDLYVTLNNVNAVIVNNSTVGLEAIAHNKAVLTLGNSYYDESNICLKMYEKKMLKNLLVEVLSYQPDKVKVINFLYYFFTEQVVEGYITDSKLIAASNVLKKISLNYKN